jgi:hypothetical protein
MRRAALLLAILMPLSACPPRAETPPASASRTRALFEFHSDPWLNLHQRLLAETQATARWHVPVTTCPCGRAPSGELLPAWADALAAYRSTYKDRDPTFDWPLADVNLALALTASEPTVKDPAASEVAPVLSAVFQGYVAATWPEDDARNRAWIAAAAPLLARWGGDLATELAKRLEGVWPSAPIRVEVSRYAGWPGAYTTHPPILITMSSEDPGYQGSAALEMLFHEASHGITGVLEHDLDMAFLAQGKRTPRALDHVIIFYTAGELARRRLVPGYVPYAYKNGVYARGWSNLERAVAVHWRAWLDDAIDLQTAVARLAQAL